MSATRQNVAGGYAAVNEAFLHAKKQNATLREVLKERAAEAAALTPSSVPPPEPTGEQLWQIAVAQYAAANEMPLERVEMLGQSTSPSLRAEAQELAAHLASSNSIVRDQASEDCVALVRRIAEEGK